MAIITDATGRRLAQAVGGIDTGGLAKDTTLQATNTALGNMNLTQQGIATAINNLGQLLGNDKANISGNNIVDKATFRQNIGIYTGQVITNEDYSSVKTGSYYQVGLSINLPAGFWYVLGSCRVELKSLNGRILGNIGRNTTFNTDDYFTQSCYSVKDVKLRVQTSAIVSPTETTSYNYVLYADDTSAIYDLFHIIAIRIL